jgi:hypothetical protein
MVCRGDEFSFCSEECECEGLQIHEKKTRVSVAIVIHTEKMVQQSSL